MISTRKTYLPFRQCHDPLPSRSLLIQETRYAKPRGVSVVLGSRRGAHHVLDDLGARVGGGAFGIGAEAANEGEASQLGGFGRREAATERGRRGE